MRQVLNAAGPAPAEEVWSRYLRPSRWPEWSPQIRRVSYPGDTIAAGSSGVVHGPVGLSVHFTVLTVDPEAMRWTWTVRVGPIRLELAHSVTGSTTGAATELVIEGPAPIVRGYLPLAQLALHRLVRR